MKCSICGTVIDCIETSIDSGWIPYFYDGETEHEYACPGCSETVLRVGQAGEMEVRSEYQGKIIYQDAESKDCHWVMGIAIHSESQDN